MAGFAGFLALGGQIADPDGLLYQQLASFGTDGFGELYVMARTAGRVYRLEIE